MQICHSRLRQRNGAWFDTRGWEKVQRCIVYIHFCDVPEVQELRRNYRYLIVTSRIKMDLRNRV
jgi:hypothetical protein